MTDTTTPTSTDLVALEKLLANPESTITFGEVSRILALRKEGVIVVPATDVPTPFTPTKAQIEAVNALLDTINGSPTPTTRRPLEEAEVRALLDERAVLDQVEKLIEKRKEIHRAAVFNHLDCEAETKLDPETLQDVSRDDKGHLLVVGSASVADRDKRFSREIRHGAEVLDDAGLQGVVGEDGFTHEDYLACTSSVRVVDEVKVMLHLRKRPGIVAALRRAIQPGKTSASLYSRNK